MRGNNFIDNFVAMKTISLYFSPTGGGKKIAKAIQSAMDGTDNDYQYFLNLNKQSLTEENGTVYDDLPVIFTIPVYGGHMPKIVRSRLEQVRSEKGQAAILVAVYGNRAFENALVDLELFVRERGFNPIAAAAFPCEHSYSTDATPIAVGRPDSIDLQSAQEFGRMVRNKILQKDFSTINAAELHDELSPENSIKNFIAFVKSYQAEQSSAPKTIIPVVDHEKCVECGECQRLCPTYAIGDDQSTDPTLCIKCCACVKFCPEKARTLDSPFAKPLSENFSLRKSPCWIL